MFKFAIISLFFMLPSCADFLPKHESDDANYFSDASSCFQSSVRKESIKVPRAGTITVIDIPLGNDSKFFGLCMAQAGHPPTQANPDDYLAISRTCFQQVHNSSPHDDTYARCVRHGKITVETIAPNHSK